MNITGTAAGNYTAPTTTRQNVPSVNAGNAATSAGSALSTKSQPDPVAAFMAYMQETPAQRMEDAWLGQHGMTRAQFDALSPEKKTAIRKEMADNIKEQMKEKQAQKHPQEPSIDILA